MTRPIDRKAFVNQLLTELACRTEGALDFWTLVCVSPIAPDVPGFIRQHCELMRSLVVVIRSQLPGNSSEAQQRAIEELRAGCDEWESAFLRLGSYRQHTHEEIVSAVQAIDRVHAQRVAAITELGRSLGSPVAHLEEQTDERRNYFRRILNTLPEVFLHARQEAMT
jgi:hypothetical protein